MTEKPFIHKFAFSDVKSNFIFHEDFAKIFVKLIKKKVLLILVVKLKQFMNLQKNIIRT